MTGSNNSLVLAQLTNALVNKTKIRIDIADMCDFDADFFFFFANCASKSLISLCLVEEFKAEYGLSTDALFVDSEVNKGGNRLESYARALERSKKMMQIIDTAIDLMRRKHKKGEFYYWILYYAYLSPQQCENAGAILQLLETKGISISLRTYYVHRDEAIEVLSSILWGYTSQDCEKITNLLTPD